MLTVISPAPRRGGGEEVTSGWNPPSSRCRSRSRHLEIDAGHLREIEVQIKMTYDPARKLPQVWDECAARSDDATAPAWPNARGPPSSMMISAMFRHLLCGDPRPASPRARSARFAKFLSPGNASPSRCRQGRHRRLSARRPSISSLGTSAWRVWAFPSIRSSPHDPVRERRLTGRRNAGRGCAPCALPCDPSSTRCAPSRRCASGSGHDRAAEPRRYRRKSPASPSRSRSTGALQRHARLHPGGLGAWPTATSSPRPGGGGRICAPSRTVCQWGWNPPDLRSSTVVDEAINDFIRQLAMSVVIVIAVLC